MTSLKRQRVGAIAGLSVVFPGKMQEFVERLLSVDPLEFAISAQPQHLEQLLAQLHACIAAVSQQIGSNRGVELERPVSTAVWLHPMNAGSGELARRCLLFADVQLLSRVRVLGRSWRAWAEADELWRHILQAQWRGTAALCDAGLSGANLASLYYRRCRLERSRTSPAASVLHQIFANDCLSDFSLLVEMSFGGRAVLDGLFDLSVTDDLNGLEARIPEGTVHLPIAAAERPASLSLTAVHRCSGKLMRICRDADILEDVRRTLSWDRYLPFDMGGDAGDGLVHPALWSVLNDPVCHHIGLTDVKFSRTPQGQILAFRSIYLGLWDPRDLINPEGAARVLTVWEEVCEWA